MIQTNIGLYIIYNWYKTFNREGVETEKFEKKSLDLYNSGKNYFLWYSLLKALLPFMLYTMLGVVLVYAYYINHSGTDFLGGRGTKGVSGAVILVFILQMVNFLPALKRILSVNIVWQTGDVSFKKLNSIFVAPDENRKKNDSPLFEKRTIEFKDASYSFADDKPILNNVSFFIPENGFTLIEGSQGSGKSILFKLILGLYRLEKGEILINGQDINLMSMHTLRKNVTMVSDELSLIGRTVFETITYSRKEKFRTPAFAMLTSLGFTDGLDKKILDASIQNGGKNLSAGQRKLLLIARALLTRKKIILLDEPFVDLDIAFKKRLVDLLYNLKKNHTIVVIDKSKDKAIEYDKIIQLGKNQFLEKHF